MASKSQPTRREDFCQLPESQWVGTTKGTEIPNVEKLSPAGQMKRGECMVAFGRPARGAVGFQIVARRENRTKPEGKRYAAFCCGVAICEQIQSVASFCSLN